VLVLAGCGSSSKSSTNSNTGGTSSSASPAANKSTIVLGYITDVTGVSSSSFADGPGGAEAVIDQQNAAGGIDGHPIKLVVKDGASSPSGNLTAAEDLVQSSHAVAIIDYSSFTFGASTYLQKQGIPVLGSAFDGPEWAVQPNSNMFSWAIPDESPVNGKYYTYTNLGKFLKDIGVTKIGGLGYAISPSSTDSILAAVQSAKTQGISKCYVNNSVAFGAVDFTSDVLQIKAAGCNGIAGSFVEASDLALSSGLSQAGLASVKQVYFTGYDQTTLATAASRAGFNGDYAEAGENFSPPNAAGTALLATLTKYDKSYKGGIPDYGLLGSTISAQLAVFGLQHAGANPTSASVIAGLSKVSSYNDGGLLPTAVDFQHFGTISMFPATDCLYFEQLKGSTWDEYSGKAVCGTRIEFKV
jgi:branched-chain amino acid transport system substrate-binding protein